MYVLTNRSTINEVEKLKSNTIRKGSYEDEKFSCIVCETSIYVMIVKRTPYPATGPMLCPK